MTTIDPKPLLILMLFSIGCGQKTLPTIPASSATAIEASSDPKAIANPAAGFQPTSFKPTPVKSADLTGVWYGVTRETGVVIQFVGRQSREPGTRGVLSGKWVVHVDRGAISSMIEFVDNDRSGNVDLEVGMFSEKAKETYTARLGRIERSDEGDLYLSIYENASEDMYLPVSRIRLKRVNDAVEINRAIVDQMRDDRETLRPA